MERDSTTLGTGGGDGRKRPERPGLGRPGGPKTAKGKARASLNAVRHGVTAKLVVIPGVEKAERWETYSAAMMASLAPVGQLETELANIIITGFWRWRRILRYERAAIMRNVAKLDEANKPSEETESSEESEYELPEDVMTPADRSRVRRICLLPDSYHLDRLMRYESHLLRYTMKALHELEAQQACRGGQPTPLARVDVHGVPEG